MAKSGKCLINTKKLTDNIIAWAKKSSTKKTFRNPYEAAFRMVETEFLIGLEEISIREVDITKGQLNSFNHRLKELDKSIKDGSLDNKFSVMFWQTSHYGKKDPVVGAVLRNMQLSNFYFRSHETSDKHLMRDMLGNLESEAIGRGIISKFGIKRAKAQKLYQKLDDRLKAAKVEFENGESKTGTKEISKIRMEMDELVNSTYLKVYEDLMYVVEGTSKEVNGKKVWVSGLPKIEQDKFNSLSKKDKSAVIDGKENLILVEKDLINTLLPDGTKVSDSPNMYKALISYKALMDGLYSRLKNGVNARIDSISSRMQKNQGVEFDNQKLRNIKDKLRSKLMPSYESGFFPHYTRDLNVDFMNGLMPYFDSLQTSSNPYKKNKDVMTVDQILDSMDGYIDGHTKRRGEGYDYSKNFLNSITNYIYDVNRFNYLSFMDKHMIDGLISVEKIYKTDGNAKGYGESIINYVKSLHVAANGNAKISPKTRAVMRTILSFEFISKLGINPRGAVRNWTQRLLDYVEWGPAQVFRTNKIIDRLSISESMIEEQLKKVGLLFEDVSPQLLESEISSPASSFKTIDYDETKKRYSFVKKSRIEKISDKMGWAAGKASFLHRKAENSNRKHTFKVGFAQMYDWLDTPRFRQSLLDKNSNYSDKQINNIIKTKARNYAVNMVVLNHFDYAEYSKSRLLRNPVGKFLGQFQHYSFEFFERNMRILREAKYDIKSGQLLPGQDAQGLSKAYRMALAYFGAPVVASILTGVNFSNLIEHDTFTRLKQFAVAMTGDDDEIEDAFYGKGPIISTFGGPLISDLIDIGTMLDLGDLDDDSLLNLIGGLEKRSEGSNNQDLARKIRLLNTFAGRAVGRHIPQLAKGRIGWALQQELGLYPTAESRKIQKKAKQSLPPDIASALEMLTMSK